MGSHIVRTRLIYQYCVLVFGLRLFSEPKHVAKILILITNICCVIDWINYCIRERLRFLDLVIYKITNSLLFQLKYLPVKKLNLSSHL